MSDAARPKPKSRVERCAANRARQQRRRENERAHRIVVPVAIGLDLVDDFGDLGLVSKNRDDPRPESARAIRILVDFALLSVTRDGKAFRDFIESRIPTEETSSACPDQEPDKWATKRNTERA